MPLEFFESLGREFSTIEEGLGELMNKLNTATDKMKNPKLSQEEYEDLLEETRALRETMNAVHDFIEGTGVLANAFEPAIDDPYEPQSFDLANLQYDPEAALEIQEPYDPEKSFAAQEDLGGDLDEGGAPIAA